VELVTSWCFANRLFCQLICQPILVRSQQYLEVVPVRLIAFAYAFLNVLVLSSCGSIEPTVNSSPTRRIVISGEKDPRLAVTFQLLYKAENTSCDSWGGAGPAQPQRRGETKTVLAGSGTLHVEFELDKYAPGQCYWQAQAITVIFSVDATKKENSPIYPFALFSEKAVLSFDDQPVTCRLKTVQKPIGLHCGPFSSRPLSLSRDGSQITTRMSLAIDR
jgi:hypothetical protein